MRKNALKTLFIMLIVMTGCSTSKSWVYKPNKYQATESIIEKKLLVLPFTDERENDNMDVSLLCYVPAMPFGWQKYYVPEDKLKHITTGAWKNYKPLSDYPMALVEEFHKTGYFSEVYFDDKPAYTDISKKDCDYYISGKILKTKYYGTVITYGLSMFGPFLWMIGFPAGTTSNELVLELTLTEKQTKKVVFTKTYNLPKKKKVIFIYYMANDFDYPMLLAKVYKQFCEDIKPLLKQFN